MVKDRKEQHGLQTTNFEKCRLKSSSVSRSKLEMNASNQLNARESENEGVNERKIKKST